jgi:hypothetical protein
VTRCAAHRLEEDTCVELLRMGMDVEEVAKIMKTSEGAQSETREEIKATAAR